MSQWKSACVRKLRDPRNSLIISLFMAEIAQNEKIRRQTISGMKEVGKLSLGYEDEQLQQSQYRTFSGTGSSKVPIVPRQMTWEDLRQVRGDQVDVNVVQVKKKSKSRKFDAMSAVFISELTMNFDSSFSETEAEANLEAFPGNKVWWKKKGRCDA